MICTFKRSKFNNDISKWDISNVRYTDGMFYKGSFNGNISQWNNKNVRSAYYMFRESNFRGDKSKWKKEHKVFTRISFFDFFDYSDLVDDPNKSSD